MSKIKIRGGQHSYPHKLKLIDLLKSFDFSESPILKCVQKTAHRTPCVEVVPGNGTTNEYVRIVLNGPSLSYEYHVVLMGNTISNTEVVRQLTRKLKVNKKVQKSHVEVSQGHPTVILLCSLLKLLRSEEIEDGHLRISNPSSILNAIGNFPNGDRATMGKKLREHGLIEKDADSFLLDLSRDLPIIAPQSMRNNGLLKKLIDSTFELLSKDRLEGGDEILRWFSSALAKTASAVKTETTRRVLLSSSSYVESKLKDWELHQKENEGESKIPPEETGALPVQNDLSEMISEIANRLRITNLGDEEGNDRIGTDIIKVLELSDSMIEKAEDAVNQARIFFDQKQAELDRTKRQRELVHRLSEAHADRANILDALDKISA